MIGFPVGGVNPRGFRDADSSVLRELTGARGGPFARRWEKIDNPRHEAKDRVRMAKAQRALAKKERGVRKPGEGPVQGCENLWARCRSATQPSAHTLHSTGARKPIDCRHEVEPAEHAEEPQFVSGDFGCGVVRVLADAHIQGWFVWLRCSVESLNGGGLREAPGRSLVKGAPPSIAVHTASNPDTPAGTVQSTCGQRSDCGVRFDSN
ncbi:hypothetical protein SZ00_03536 [Rhodococcus sp. AD45]|nr:hypothetical protein SZ00_03536 [Rhodococcus sp. AD45]